MGNVEVDELSAVVVALAKGDREADLPYQGGGAIGHSREGLGWLQLIIWHLEAVEHLDGENIEPCTAVDEGLGNLHIPDDWGTQHREDAGSGRALELICRVESDGAVGPPERTRDLKLGEHRVHLASEPFEDA